MTKSLFDLVAEAPKAESESEKLNQVSTEILNEMTFLLK
jgi:hypothetical protein